MQFCAGGFVDDCLVDCAGYSTLSNNGVAELVDWEEFAAEEIAGFKVNDLEVRECGFEGLVREASKDGAADCVWSVF